MAQVDKYFFKFNVKKLLTNLAAITDASLIVGPCTHIFKYLVALSKKKLILCIVIAIISFALSSRLHFNGSPKSGLAKVKASMQAAKTASEAVKKSARPRAAAPAPSYD